MVHFCSVSMKIIILTLFVYATNAFNYSPKPNLVFREPTLNTLMPKVRSSYFGFTINLRESSIIIGAPRAQSRLESQSEINETGAIYKCPFNSTCAPYVFDRRGNIYDEESEYTYDSKIKHNQWLGGSMDGGSKDTDKLVVCAPRLMAIIEKDDYAMHGICYWTPDTLTDHPQNIRKISPLLLRKQQMRELNGIRYPYNIFGEQGISVHLTNNEEILVGAPGLHTWKGTVIRHHRNAVDFQIRMSRRDLDGRRVVRQSPVFYTTEVPNPETWNQANDSYFGYSVSSGYFDDTQPNKTFYISSAPQANEQSGEAYIFDIVTNPFGEYTIRKYHTFHGTQFGEYYGYAVLAEDLNGDGLTDVIITAPQYSWAGNVEQGALYVYINKGKFVFELQKIMSPINGRGRFGTSISKLGDINRDGFNDVAVAAPFADNGAVFIYLGSLEGLRKLHSQKLEVVSGPTSWGSQMFGHGLSRGFDFDKNGFNDLAIGAPNADSVYVYQAYPVVKVLATINSLSREIKPDQNHFQIRLCYMISTTLSKIQSQDLAIRVSVDQHVKRVTLLETGFGELCFNATATTQDQCRMLEARVRFSTADVFKPIELEMHYELINGVPNSEVFCDKCAAVDPTDPKVSLEKIAFNTGCKTDICIADLNVTSSGINSSYILGSSRTIAVTYEVSNSGETAYLPQINISSPNRIPFAKIPSSCSQHGYVLLCDLNRGQPMAVGSRIMIPIVYDISQFEGTSITLTAAVFSMGKEQSPADNTIHDVIALKEFTEIEVVGKAQPPYIDLKKVFNTTEIINTYEIKSNGPSRIQELEITFQIPIAYKGSSVTAPTIDMSSITVQGVYDQQQLGVEFYQDGVLLLLNASEISTTSTQTVVVQNGKRIAHHSFKSTSIDLQQNFNQIYSSGLQRKRREIEQIGSENIHTKAAHKNPHDVLSEELAGTLPINRTILFSCTNPETTTCVRAVLRVYNFQPDMPVTVTLKYNVDLKKVNEIVIDQWEFFVIIAKLDILKVGDKDNNSTLIKKKIEYNVISQTQLYTSIPYWVWYILAAVGGLVILGAISYGLHKAGFLKRKERERLLQAQRQVAEAENIDE